MKKTNSPREGGEASAGRGEGTSPGRRIRIFIADDHPVTREGLRAVLAQPDLEVVGEAATGRAAVEGVQKLEPDLVILDVQMEDMDGLEALIRIKAWRPEIAILMYTAFPDIDYLTVAVDEGASGFLLKGAGREELLGVIRRIATGEFCLDSAWRVPILREIVARAKAPKPGTGTQPLSPRELEILRVIAQGMTTEEVAQALSVTTYTVHAHIKSILAKLRVPDRTQALVWAARRKLVTFE